MTIASDGTLTFTANPVAITGLTSPTYGTTAGNPPDTNSKRYAVTTLGGTQTNVRAHSVSDPFTITAYQPKVVKAVPVANQNTGIIVNVPKNTYGIHLQKGVKINATSGQLSQVDIKTVFQVPAGSDNADSINIRAAVAAYIAFLIENSEGICATLETNVL